MSEETKNVGANAQSPAKPRARRGVSNETKAVSQLRFHEKDASSNGLFIGHLHDVTVDWSTNADGKVFTGMAMPRLTFHFASNHANPNEQRHVYQTLFPQESNVDTIPGGSKEWMVNNVFAWIKHMLDIFYLKGRELTPEEEDALALSFEDYIINDQNQVEYNPVSPEEVLAGYRTVFENAAAMMNGQFNLKDGETPKPCYKATDGKYLPCWIKLLRHVKGKNGWTNVGQNGELAFSNFIGSGAVELLVKDKLPAILRIDISRESITPKEINKTPTIGAPGMPSMNGSVMAGGPVSAMGVGGDAYQAAGADDMPF